MKCEMIRDLFPSYVDGLTSEVSNTAIEDHLAHCESCRTHLECMMKSLDSPSAEVPEDLQPFLKVRKEMVRKLTLAVVATLVICAVVYGKYTDYRYNAYSAKAEDVEMTIIRDRGVTALCFQAKDEKKWVYVGETENQMVDGKMPLRTLVVNQKNGPYADDCMKEEYAVYFTDEDTMVDLFADPGEVTYDEEDFIAIEFADTVKTIRITDFKNGICKNQ